jgi:putative spermidine/putrescine transport system permease protein
MGAAAPAFRRTAVPALARRLTAVIDRHALLLLPGVALLVLVFAYPVGEMLWRSVSDFPTDGSAWSDNYAWFFDSSTNVRIFVRTFVTGLWVTFVCLLLGYPYAYLMTLATGRWRIVMLAVVLLPFWTSFIVRNFAWIVLLQDNGPVATGLGKLGFGSVELLGTTAAVTIGMAQILLPFMVLPAYATMSRIDRDLVRAAEGLGARPVVAFLRVYVPLSLPGVLAGALLVFVISLGFYITPAMLGSPENAMLSQVIVTQVGDLLAWGRAGAMALVLLVVTLTLVGIAARLSRRSLANLGGA